jgi:arginyl-tRNA synthetase
MWSQTREAIAQAVQAALRAAVQDGTLRLEAIPPVVIENPKEEAHGDLACTVALGLARVAKMAPRKIAEAILAHLETTEDIAKVELAGPGFINFFLSEAWLRKTLCAILDAGDAYGTSSVYSGQTAQVEFVSANPTGPLTLGHGRQAVLGDSIARLMEAVGYTITREYYFNDGGRQMRVLGESVRARYLELLGKPATFPDDGYQGEYIRDIAGQLIQERGESLVDAPDATPFTQRAVEAIFQDIRRTLERLGIAFDVYYNELSLYEDGYVQEVADELRQRGYAYEQDGALWFKATEFGLPQDRVIVRSTGEPTYRLPDIAYHRQKVRRGFDRIVDIFGADHIDTYPDVKAGLEALGYRTDHITVLIHQFVTITKGGETIKMSTRKANFVTVDELMDEVGEDAVRLFFVLRNMNSHLNFDIELAKQASNENPVYYLQYAHARIASIFRQAEERCVSLSETDAADLGLLTTPEEIALIKKCGEFPDVVRDAADNLEPHRIPHYLNDVATAFHLFYDRCRVLDGENVPLTHARLSLSKATQIVLANGLRLIGVRAPERM